LHSFFHNQQVATGFKPSEAALEVLRMEVEKEQLTLDLINEDLADSKLHTKIWLGRRTNTKHIPQIKQIRKRDLQNNNLDLILNDMSVSSLDFLKETGALGERSFGELQEHIHVLAFSLEEGGGFATPASMSIDMKTPEVGSARQVSPPRTDAPRERVVERTAMRREGQPSPGHEYQNPTPRTLPSAPVLVGRARALARLDTQSALSYIDVTWAREIGLTVDTEIKRRVVGISKRSTESLGTAFADVTLGITTRRLKLDVFDRKEDDCKILLGWDAMPLYGIGLHRPLHGGMPTAYPEALAKDEEVMSKMRAAYTGSDDFEMSGGTDRREKMYSNKVRLSEEDRLDEQYVNGLKNLGS
jgi:hypothetical protein